MLQPDAFYEHTMQQNATAAWAPPRTSLGELTALPRPLSWFLGAASRQGGVEEGRKGERRGGEGKGRRGTGREERSREGGEGEGRGG